MSDVEPGDEIVVKYGVKELLAIQGKTLERIELKVDQNAITQAEASAKLDLRVALLESLKLGPRVERLERFRFAFPSLALLGVLASLALLAMYLVHWHT